MAAFGSKALPKKPKSQNTQIAGEETLPKQKEQKKSLQHSKPKPQNTKMAGENPLHKQKDRKKSNNKNKRPNSKEHSQKDKAPHKFSNHQHSPIPQAPILRKRVDPETAKYFVEIANLFEEGELDADERSVVCGNALEETRGKEVEVATDPIISRTLQTLLEGCDVGQLCDFLRGCGKELPLIAADKSGSHVVETALKSLSLHLQDAEAYAIIEETVTKMLQVIVVNPVDVMCSRYGSHVLRSLLCFCKGVPLDSSEDFHVTKSSTLLAERLSSSLPQPSVDHFRHLNQGLPDLLKFLVEGLLKHAKEDIAALRVNMYSSLVMQTALKLLVGDDEELLRVIPVLLGCHEDTISEGKFIEPTAVREIIDLLKDTAYSHLMEVILEVAPETLHNEIFRSVFKGSLFDISSHHCGSFVVQAIISSASSQGQIDVVWEELGPKIKDLLANGKSGVVASLLAACKRLNTHGRECCQALAAAVCSSSESPSCIIQRILFLEDYYCCEDKPSWNWLKGNKMHTLGCLILQTIFKYSSEFIQPYIKGIVSMEADHVIETAKDAGGGRVLESFLCSDASAKHKNKVIAKLRGNFGELSMHPSGSFTVEKSFAAVNLSLKEVIATELLAVQAELYRTRHGPYLLKKLDVDGFAKRPDQWKARQASRQSAYKDFAATFSSETKSQNKSIGSAQPNRPLSAQKSLKKMRKEINQCVGVSLEFPGLENSMAKLGFSAWKHPKLENFGGTATGHHTPKKFMRNGKDAPSMGNKGKAKRERLATDNADPSNKHTKKAKIEKGDSQIDGISAPLKKQKR
ncbi:hypothetical protein MRB53_033736 [Persea americana]|uniref:Uncharacterized protein n=1 Tax=Persea americana TaxID=3435 RepID=A0ACC2KWE6_PERAE|nr:hypothetical protein MRB53_033736 [Persea americana]